MPKLSVIIPIYNCAALLPRCIDSILSQSFRNFELILVNDGSKDESPQVCERYAQTDPRIVFLSKPNGGVSSARNMGIDHAKGEWITFIDADDWIDPGTFELCTGRDDADIIRFSVRQVYSPTCKVEYKFRDFQSKDEYLSAIIAWEGMLGSWGAFYRLSLLREYGIRFNEHISFGEDWLLLCQIIYHASKVEIINKAMYNYDLTNESSCVHNMTIKKHLENLQGYSIIHNMIARDSRYRLPLRKAKARLYKECTRILFLNQDMTSGEKCRNLHKVREILGPISIKDSFRYLKFKQAAFLLPFRLGLAPLMFLR